MTNSTIFGENIAAVLITYDLHRPGQDYTALHEAIKGLGDWAHYLESTWLVSTTLAPSTVWARLKGSVDDNDRVLIIDVTSRACAGWLSEAAWEWIRKHV